MVGLFQMEFLLQVLVLEQVEQAVTGKPIQFQMLAAQEQVMDQAVVVEPVDIMEA
jgi:hypothetical protein